MDRFVLEGGVPLTGEVRVSGAKNAVLPLLAVSLLFREPVHLTNVPRVRDTFTMIELLRLLGAEVQWDDAHTLTIRAEHLKSVRAPYDIVRKMRASIYVLGPLLVREGHAEVSLPGGCAFGPRPVNFHLEGLKRMGAQVDLEEGYILAHHQGLHGAEIAFDRTSVGATAHLMMVASTIPEETVIYNAAKEPEVQTLGRFLREAGAQIHGLGTDTLRIHGTPELSPPETFRVLSDRIEAGTFAVAAAITHGRVRILDVTPDLLPSVLPKLQAAGAQVTVGKNWIEVQGPADRPRPVDLETAPFPGFPTDMQAQFMALMTVADGSSIIREGIYPDRFKHAYELVRMGADIRVEGDTALVRGVPELKGAPVMASDLRASAALVLAGLVAKGKTEIHRIYHLDRGYEDFEKKLAALGAKIRRVSE